MLLQIEIKNIVIIDYALVDFSDGFHVLTGETGAGKSIILKSIGMLMGERAQKELIRIGEEKAEVAGVFAINSQNRDIIEELLGPIEDDYIRVERILYEDGKSVAKINGKIETVKTMKEIVHRTLEICGQKSHIDLIKESYYRELVDSLAPPSFTDTLDEYKSVFGQWKEKKKELDKWLKSDKEQEQMLDLYRYQLAEIEEANLNEQEEQELEQERKKLSSFQSLTARLQGALSVLEHIQDFHHVEQATDMMANLEEEYRQLNERTISVSTELEDIKYELTRYTDGLEYDENRLNTIILREEEIKKIKRKYGNGQSIESVNDYYAEIKQTLVQYESKEEVISSLEKEIVQLEKKLDTLASTMHKEREKVAHTFSKKIEDELKDLAMPHAQFSMEVTSLPQWNEHGKSDVQAFFNANKGGLPRPLNKIASGGEMSRVLLAIKVVVNEEKVGKTLIFDEVDEGIGGDVGLIIGEKMEKIGRKTQVVVISHLPQVAAKASHHYRIEKNDRGKRTYSTIQPLSDEERVYEVSRMLYGKEANKTTHEHARKMLEKEKELS